MESVADTAVFIRYHVWWPSSSDPYYQYNTNENVARKNYYGFTGVPTYKVDGFITGGNSSGYMNIMRNRYYMESPLEINLSGLFNGDTYAGTLDVSITATDDASWDDLVVRIVLTESDLYYPAPNGAVWHHQTMRDMIPSHAGAPLEITTGETVDFSQAFSCPSALVAENCELVVFVQNEYNKEIYQAAKIPVTFLSSIDEDTNLPTSFSLTQNYPNPFNAGTAISYSLKNAGEVQLAIYDISGRKVIDLVNGVQSAGNHEIIWNGNDANGTSAATGVYFYKLTMAGNSTTKRMVLLK
ncbi:MAG: T9SS type A sorting domain-containing protein [candidate division Zixibacteria bacterium]|nr:T9SS type A sorting domain-containing protein [candidate division Zixibacteria bacterium]